MKLILGNIFFAAIELAWYLSYAHDRSTLLAGLLVSGLAFISGICVGALLMTKSNATPHPPRYSSHESINPDLLNCIH